MIARIELTLRLFYDQFALICTDNLKNALGDESVAERVLFFQRNFFIWEKLLYFRVYSDKNN